VNRNEQAVDRSEHAEDRREPGVDRREFALGRRGRPLDLREQRGKEHLPLPVAAATVYHQLVGTTAAIRDSSDLDEALNRAAVALSKVVPLYVLDRPSMMPRQITPTELIHGVFTRAATRFTVRDGTVYRLVTVRRHDMRDAVTILKRACVRLK
jgi:hypothetical protein